jgi:hypothetical protein
MLTSSIWNTLYFFKNKSYKNLKKKKEIKKFDKVNKNKKQFFFINLKIIKFKVMKPSFKHTKFREQYCLKRFSYNFLNFEISSKIYEIIISKFYFFSNNKSFDLFKVEKRIIVL